MNYKEYTDLWLDGIYDEILFWKNYIESEGAGFDQKRWKDQIDFNLPFRLEDELPEDKNARVKFADIGSGPFSRCGRVTDKVQLEITAVDPLADIYELLKKNNHINNGIFVEQGFVELLDKKFEPNTFDIVHMSNALDHCFDPMYGIFQLLNICRTGGKIILRHAENEAHPYYSGLHQWNLSLHNKENSFVIWRREEDRFDVCREFAEYADFELYPDLIEDNGTWVHNKVVMIKKKDIVIPKREYLYVLFENMYRKFTGLMLERAVSRQDLRKKLVQAVENISALKLKERFGFSSVAICGMGDAGKALFDKLKEAGITIGCTIDRQKVIYQNTESIGYGEMEPDKSDFVIVTAVNGIEEAVMMLKQNGISDEKIIVLQKLLQ